MAINKQISFILTFVSIAIASSQASPISGTSIKCSDPPGTEIDPATIVRDVTESVKQCVKCMCNDIGRIECDWAQTPCTSLNTSSPKPKSRTSAAAATTAISTTSTTTTTTTTTPAPNPYGWRTLPPKAKKDENFMDYDADLDTDSSSSESRTTTTTTTTRAPVLRSTTTRAPMIRTTIAKVSTTKVPTTLAPTTTEMPDTTTQIISLKRKQIPIATRTPETTAIREIDENTIIEKADPVPLATMQLSSLFSDDIKLQFIRLLNVICLAILLGVFIALINCTSGLLDKFRRTEKSENNYPKNLRTNLAQDRLKTRLDYDGFQV